MRKLKEGAFEYMTLNGLGINKSHFKEVINIAAKYVAEHNSLSTGLTDREYFAVCFLCMQFPQIIQEEAKNDCGNLNFASDLVIELDRALFKMPSCEVEYLYRQDKFQLESDLSIGDVFTPNWFLTTSIEDYDNTNNVKFIIKPLSENSRAKKLFQYYNHGEGFVPYPEYQVNFMRNTSFRIIDKIIKDTFTEIHLEELP